MVLAIGGGERIELDQKKTGNGAQLSWGKVGTSVAKQLCWAHSGIQHVKAHVWYYVSYPGSPISGHHGGAQHRKIPQ